MSEWDGSDVLFAGFLAFLIGTTSCGSFHRWASKDLCQKAGYSNGEFVATKGIVCQSDHVQPLAERAK